MTDEIPMRRFGDALHAVDEVSAQQLRAAAKEGADVLVVVRSRRNPDQHRFAWALASKVAEACGFFDPEDAMDFLKIKARHVRYVTDPRTGQIHLVPKSINFASCTQAEFSRLINRMVWLVCSEILPGISEEELRAEVEAMVAPTDRRRGLRADPRRTQPSPRPRPAELARRRA